MEDNRNSYSASSPDNIASVMLYMFIGLACFSVSHVAGRLGRHTNFEQAKDIAEQSGSREILALVLLKYGRVTGQRQRRDGYTLVARDEKEDTPVAAANTDTSHTHDIPLATASPIVNHDEGETEDVEMAEAKPAPPLPSIAQVTECSICWSAPYNYNTKRQAGSKIDHDEEENRLFCYNNSNRF